MCDWSVCFFPLLSLCIGAVPCAAGATDFEQSVSATLASRAAPGEEIWLPGPDDRAALALYRSSALTGTGRSVLLIHSISGHADWPDVVSPLRHGLPDLGWPTLSVQMPLLRPDASMPEYGETVGSGTRRLTTAVNFLDKRQMTPVVIIGYGFGGAIATRYLELGDTRVLGLIGISMYEPRFLKPRMNFLSSLQKLRLPVLDIFAEHDLHTVLLTVDDRRLAGRSSARGAYTQIRINKAQHDYANRQNRLLMTVNLWLSDLYRQYMRAGSL